MGRERGEPPRAWVGGRAPTRPLPPPGALPLLCCAAEGLASFRKATVDLLLGADCAAVKEGRVATLQSLSGTGSLRVGTAFFAKFLPQGAPRWLGVGGLVAPGRSIARTTCRPPSCGLLSAAGVASAAPADGVRAALAPPSLQAPRCTSPAPPGATTRTSAPTRGWSGRSTGEGGVGLRLERRSNACMQRVARAAAAREEGGRSHWEAGRPGGKLCRMHATVAALPKSPRISQSHLPATRPPPLPCSYFDAETIGLDFAGMIADLEAAPAGSIILLHGRWGQLLRLLGCCLPRSQRSRRCGAAGARIHVSSPRSTMLVPSDLPHTAWPPRWSQAARTTRRASIPPRSSGPRLPT